MSCNFFFRDGLQIDKKTAKSIWCPVINFENLLKYELTKTYGNSVIYNLWLYDDHLLYYGEAFQLTFPCRFYLSKFPFDSHECFIYFGDERYSTDTLMIYNFTLYYGMNSNYGTNKENVPLILDDLALPLGFELEVLPMREKDFNYNVSQAGILIRMERESLGQLLSGYYYPTASFALLSMVSFAINPDVV